jgi:hypothetical protein
MGVFEAIKEAVEPDPYNPARFRLDQDYTTLQVETVAVSIPVRKPNKQEFIRIRPEPGFQVAVALLELQEDRDHYLISPECVGAVADHCAPVTLYTAVNRHGALFLWPAKMPRPGARVLAWHQSAHRAADLAKAHWVQLRANMSTHAYDVSVAKGDLADPEWPDMSFEEIFRIAFQDHLIDSLDHPVLRRLDGRE